MLDSILDIEARGDTAFNCPSELSGTVVDIISRWAEGTRSRLILSGCGFPHYHFNAANEWHIDELVLIAPEDRTMTNLDAFGCFCNVRSLRLDGVILTDGVGDMRAVLQGMQTLQELRIDEPEISGQDCIDLCDIIMTTRPDSLRVALLALGTVSQEQRMICTDTFYTVFMPGSIAFTQVVVPGVAGVLGVICEGG